MVLVDITARDPRGGFRCDDSGVCAVTSSAESGRSSSGVARAAADDEFVRLADPFRSELLTHCYRMTGSVHDAEDLVQETYLRAWRSYGGFEGRASLRTWLYRMATNVCLTALEGRSRRPMPSGLGPARTEAEGRLDAIPAEIRWLQPFPDARGAADSADPASIVAARSGMRLALIAALQHLHPRQRAVLILRDVLAWRAAEVAELLDVSVPAANSLLQRARARLEQVAPDADDVSEPADTELRGLVDRYASAFENGDVETLLTLLTADAVWEMPPQPMWFRGREVVGRLIAYRLALYAHGPEAGRRRLLPTTANGQPAFGFYNRDEAGILRATSIQVLTLSAAGDRIAPGLGVPGSGAVRGVRPAGDLVRGGWLAGSARRQRGPKATRPEGNAARRQRGPTATRPDGNAARRQPARGQSGLQAIRRDDNRA